MADALAKVEQVAPTDATVLGETGTGKDLIARAVHRRSRRSQGPLIKLNCGALPTAKSMKVDVRVIAATNRDLGQAVATGAFRADLFYRLNVFPIEVPPLRERKADIGLLAQHFAQKYATRFGKPFEGIQESTLERRRAYPWPGNIRELENVIERAVIVSVGGVLEVAPAVLGLQPGAAAAPVVDERQQLVRALADAHGVIEGERGAAKALGLHPNTLRSRMKKLGIERPRG